MDLRQLEYVLAVAEELHFGRAAARMHVTQQSVSEQIRRLERELGAPLFARTSRRVTLTAVGESFLPEARRALAAARHALDVGRRAADDETAQVRLGFADGELSSRLFQVALPRFALRAPSARVVPQPLSARELLTACVERRLDLAVTWMPVHLPDGLTSLLLAREPLVVVLAAHHPLAACDTVDPVRLSHQPLTLAPRDVNPHLHDCIVGNLVIRGAIVTIGEEVSHMKWRLPLVLAGSAVAITVLSVAVANSVAGVVYRCFTGPSPYVDYSLVWRRDNSSAALVDLIDVVRELRDSGAFVPPELEL